MTRRRPSTSRRGVFTLRVYYTRPDDPPYEERFWNPAAAWARYHDLKASDPSITRGVVIPSRVDEPGDED
jgi:hypothetical protein